MPSSAADKKRHVSRPLSPTHKRRKSAPSMHGHGTIYTQASAPQKIRRAKIAGGVSELDRSKPPQPAFPENLPRNDFTNVTRTSREADAPPSLSTHGLAVRSKSLPTDVDQKDINAQRDPQFHSRSWSGHRFSASETLAIRDHVMRTREKRTRAAANGGIKKGNISATRSVKLARKAARSSNWSSTSASLKCSVPSNRSRAISPLDLGSPVSVCDSPLTLGLTPSLASLKSTDNRSPTYLSRYVDTYPTDLPARKLSSEWNISNASEQQSRSERSGCPSPSPSAPCEEPLRGAYSSSKRSMDTAIDPKDSMLKPIVLKPISVTDLDGSEALFSKKLSDVLVAFTNPLNGRSVVKDRSECNKYGLNSYMAGMTGSTNPLVGWNGDSLQFGAPDALILFPVMIRDIAIQEADDGGGGFGKDRAVNTQSSSEDSYESGIMPHRRRSHTQATSDASGPLEPFPDLKETDLQYTGNTTNGLSSTAVYGRYPGQGGDHPNGYSHGAQIKEPHTCSNFAAPAGNTRIMSGTSDYPTRGAGAGSVASMVDPSLQAGVYHAVTRVTSRTSVPTLDPRGGEPVRFYPRGIDTIHQDEESPTSDGPHNAKSCQSMDSQGIIEHDTDVAFRKTPVNQPPRDYPSPQNLLSEPAHAAGEPSNGASTVQTVPPTHKHQAGESTKKDLNSVSTGVPGEASGGPHRGATSVAAGVRASLRAFEEKAKRISERRKEARERRENIRRLLAEYRWNPEPNQPERTPPGPAPLVTAPRESPSPKSPSPKSPSPGPTGAEPTASEHVASERVASDPPAPEPAPLETAPRESPSPKSTSPGSTRAVPTASKVIASEQVAPEHVALVSPVSDAPASEPAPQSRPTTMRTPPSRRRATTSSDEAVCCICDCFGSLRSVCCGRKPTRYSPILLEQRRADTVAASDTRMTENRVTEYLEQLEDHYSLRASEASFYQREDGRTPQNSVRPRSHGRESSRSATNAAPATSVQDVAQSRDEHAEKRSVTAPPQRS